LTKLIKLQQVTSGYVRDDDGQDRHVGNSKRNLLADVLSDLPREEPVVVFCRFKHDLQAVHDVASKDGRKSFELSGNRKELQDWTKSQEGGEVIAVQLKSGGEGIPMYKARYVVDYSLSFSLGEYNQTRSRLQRPEQTRQVISIALVAEGTVDTQIYRALKKKKKVVESIMNDYKGGSNDE
jgi:SNF2 family DNA or RNA helicase